MDWEARIDAIWESASGVDGDDELIARIDAVAAERGPDDARALFERAGARDSADQPQEAVPLYRRALEIGLDDEHRPQAVIQLASSLRNLGETDEALRVLAEEEARDSSSPYRDAIAVVHALTLATAGRPVEGLSVALLALVPHLPRYHRSMTAYARELVADSAPLGEDGDADAAAEAD